MDDSPTVKTLYSRYKKHLAMHWIAGQKGENRPINLLDNSHGASLVGHLNTINPSRIQIIGILEIEHLNNLNSEQRHELIERLFNSQPAAIILSDKLESPDDLRQCADQQQIPLIGSRHSGSKLISSLHHYLGSELAAHVIIHGVFLEVNGMGVLLTGQSGVGKSELALELISRKHRLIADDAPEFSRVGPDTVRGNCPEVIRDFLEVRGLGILNIRAMYGDSAIKLSKDLHLIINLKRMDLEDIKQVDRLNGSVINKNILEVEIPEVTLPVASGRNLAVLVEAAVLHHILLRKGYDATDAFSTRQSQLINQNPAT